MRRFLRLLEILGDWYERGKVLVFVSSQEQCDNLFRDLLKVSPPSHVDVFTASCVITFALIGDATGSPCFPLWAARLCDNMIKTPASHSSEGCD